MFHIWYKSASKYCVNQYFGLKFHFEKIFDSSKPLVVQQEVLLGFYFHIKEIFKCSFEIRIYNYPQDAVLWKICFLYLIYFLFFPFYFFSYDKYAYFIIVLNLGSLQYNNDFKPSKGLELKHCILKCNHELYTHSIWNMICWNNLCLKKVFFCRTKGKA